MGKKMIDKSRTDEIRRRGGVTNTSEKTREAGLRWLGQLEITHRGVVKENMLDGN